MKTHSRSGRGALRAGLFAGLAAMLMACTADDTEQQTLDEDAQPRNATYDCGEGGTISVVNNKTVVSLVEEGSGEFYELPASPPTQTSRFGEGGLALVVEGREALWMKAGSEPLTCRR